MNRSPTGPPLARRVVNGLYWAEKKFKWLVQTGTERLALMLASGVSYTGETQEVATNGNIASSPTIQPMRFRAVFLALHHALDRQDLRPQRELFSGDGVSLHSINTGNRTVEDSSGWAV
jgi:hypothetical protein